MGETVAKYHCTEVYKVVWRALLDYFCREKGFPDDLLSIEIDLKWVQKGGGLSDSDLVLTYGAEKKWAQFQELETITRGDYLLFNTVFDVPVAFVCARLVDIFDSQGHKKGEEYTFLPDLGDALEFVYNAAGFALNRSPFFEALKAEPLKFLHRRPKVKEWLVAQRLKGRRLLLVSNSDVDFAEFVMQVSLGEEWRSLFDLSVFFARKGRGFFELPPEETPFITLPNYPDPHNVPIKLGMATNSTGGKLNERGEAAVKVLLNGCYVQGHYSLISEEILGCAAERAVYFGDHITSDIVVTRKRSPWHAFAIIEEANSNFFSSSSPSSTVGV
eukprot:CAMPEP_0179415934 /NCGR_PEP_ID=MMETSP0799-20121207/6517_1 /TAXON_ID=46947 /ORGANISM="Geminigera cryophila, Strain CCMP2564" /LENGTH=329 /DNA_ID=CAMNT_0021188747 /DNA_START=648 /DNA_END=1633 /DNA_ORIENTATION=-